MTRTSSLKGLALLMLASLLSLPALADKYDDALNSFRMQDATAPFFAEAHGYALFPTIGKGGIGIGGAFGEGRVYEQGTYIGDAKMSQVTVGIQLGGQA